MLEEISEKLCRVYTIPCPACGTQNRHARLKLDVFRVPEQAPDGQPLQVVWREEGDFPEWVNPLHYFWAPCGRCYYTAQLDDAGFRQWKKSSTKYLAQYREGALGNLSSRAGSGDGVSQKLGKSMVPNDPFGSVLLQFFLGVFSECLKNSPLPSTMARSYLRIAWIYRDEESIYKPFAESSNVRDVLKSAAPLWKAELPENSSYPVPPAIVTDEVTALRQALTFFEWNFAALEQASHEDEVRLMALIAEIGYRLYELTEGDEEFKKAQNLFSGAMQKCLGIINDKNIVGGAVNRAKDALEKAGDRGRELRALREKAAKRPKGARPEAPAQPSPPEPAEAAGKSAEPAEPAEPTPPPEAPPVKPVAVGAPASLQTLQQRVTQLDEENKRWMRLAGISEVTGLPNRVMLSRVLLPGAVKQAKAKKEPIGCILVAPEGLAEINGKYGHERGNLVIKKFAECLKGLLKRGERLSHTEGVIFAVIVPTVPPRQLRKRAEIIHKELASRRFDLEGHTLSLKISMGVIGLDSSKASSLGSPQEEFYSHGLNALHVAKLKGNSIEVHGEAVPAR